jgi:hypothetical protein
MVTSDCEKLRGGCTFQALFVQVKGRRNLSQFVDRHLATPVTS